MLAVVDKMIGLNNIITYNALIPELTVIISALVFLLGGAFAADKDADRRFLALGTFVLVAVFAMTAFSPLLIKKQYFFSFMLVVDGFSQTMKLLMILSTILIFVISDSWLVRDGNQRFEYMVLMLFSLLGMMFMVSANDLLALYVGLELSSLPLYVLASFSRDNLKSTESGLKYFVLSALASGILLFGISLVYGFAGSMNFDTLAQLLRNPHAISSALVFGLVLIITGLSFKVSAAPFHMWTPDVYEGAPTPVTAYFSTAPKIAALALFIRVLVEPFGAMIHDWQQVVVFVSALSMLVGAFGALMQSNIKRLLAYSSIGHVGYALMGLAAGNIDGVSSVIIYFALYIAMSAGAFACVLMMQRRGELCEGIGDLAGISRKHPQMAFALAVFMFSMAGIPPLAGFFGKAYVFLAAIHAGLFALAVIGVLSSVVACFYYLKIVKIMYFDEVGEGFDVDIPVTLNATMYFCAAVTVLFFAVPTPLVTMAYTAAEALFQ